MPSALISEENLFPGPAGKKPKVEFHSRELGLQPLDCEPRQPVYHETTSGDRPGRERQFYPPLALPMAFEKERELDINQTKLRLESSEELRLDTDPQLSHVNLSSKGSGSKRRWETSGSDSWLQLGLGTSSTSAGESKHIVQPSQVSKTPVTRPESADVGPSGREGRQRIIGTSITPTSERQEASHELAVQTSLREQHLSLSLPLRPIQTHPHYGSDSLGRTAALAVSPGRAGLASSYGAHAPVTQTERFEGLDAWAGRETQGWFGQPVGQFSGPMNTRLIPVVPVVPLLARTMASATPPGTGRFMHRSGGVGQVPSTDQNVYPPTSLLNFPFPERGPPFEQLSGVTREPAGARQSSGEDMQRVESLFPLGPRMQRTVQSSHPPQTAVNWRAQPGAGPSIPQRPQALESKLPWSETAVSTSTRMLQPRGFLDWREASNVVLQNAALESQKSQVEAQVLEGGSWPKFLYNEPQPPPEHVHVTSQRIARELNPLPSGRESQQHRAGLKWTFEKSGAGPHQTSAVEHKLGDPPTHLVQQLEGAPGPSGEGRLTYYPRQRPSQISWPDPPGGSFFNPSPGTSSRPEPIFLEVPVSNLRSASGPDPGLWFTLQAAENQAGNALEQIPQVYIRVKDERMTVSAVKTYLVNKFGLSESEIEIACMGQHLSPSLPLQHVRNTIWLPLSSRPAQIPEHHASSADVDVRLREGRARPLSDGSVVLSEDVVMILTYSRHPPAASPSL